MMTIRPESYDSDAPYPTTQSIDSDLPFISDDRLEVDFGSDQESPVEVALQDNAGLFQTTAQVWRDALKEQNDFYEVYEPLDFVQPPTMIAQQVSARALRRSRSRAAMPLKNNLFVDMRRMAHDAAQKLVATHPHAFTDEVDSEKTLQDFIAPYLERADAIDFSGVERAGYSQEEAKKSSFEPLLRLLPQFVRAEALSIVALNQIRNQLTDIESCQYLLERVVAMADNKASASELPGFLELIASDLAINGDDSVIAEALSTLDFSPESQARAFLEDILSDASPIRENRQAKEISAAYGVLRPVAALFDEVTTMEKGTFIDNFASRVDTWPQLLVVSLTQFAASHRVQMREEVKRALAPFTRKGRQVPFAGSKFGVIVAESAAENSKTNKRPKQQGTADSNSEIVAEEAEIEQPEPISKFAILIKNGSQNNNTITPLLVDGIDTLLGQQIFQDYFKRHVHEQTLPDAIRMTVEHITLHPYDRKGSKVLGAAPYSLKDKDSGTRAGQKRFLRQFKPTTVPEVHGRIAVQTRIIYDIIRIDGQLTVAIFDICIKQDIENTDRMLLRR